MLTVYHFLLDHRIGGPHVYVETLKGALADQSRAVVLTSGKGPMTDLALINLRHWWAPLYVLEVLANVALILLLVLRRKIRTGGAIFHVHGGANVAPLIAARLIGVPVLWHLHETTTTFRKLVRIGVHILRGAKHEVATVAQKAVPVYGLSHAVMLPGAVDLRFWSKTQVAQASYSATNWQEAPSGDGTERVLKVLTVGNLNPLKGQDLLLAALHSYDGAFHLKIVGSELATQADYANQLRRLAKDAEGSGPGRRVEFLGWRDKDAVRALMASCDVFVMPSRSEACPLVLLEALAMDCVCVASDVGDVRAMTAEAHRTRIVHPESGEALREALSDAATAARVSAATPGGQWHQVPAQWQLATLASKTTRIYCKLVPDHGY